MNRQGPHHAAEKSITIFNAKFKHQESKKYGHMPIC